MEVKCDLILLSWNNLPLLKKSVDSILRCTKERCRLIIVDNASTEHGLKEYLLTLKGGANIEIETVFNCVNEGFARGMNKGLKMSNAGFACILNNDIIVTDGWLTEMIKAAQSDPSIGIVNPSSNNFGLRARGGVSAEKLAAGLRKDSGRWIEMNAGVGFCMLIKREVMKKIGYLDDEYGFAYFEDTDYSRRAQKAGYICVMAKGCYVYHEEGRSGKFLKDKKRTFDRSARIFEKKWGKVLRVAYVLTCGDAGSGRRITESIRRELDRHNRVWLFIERGLEIGPLPGHLDLMAQAKPKNFFKLRSFWNIIKKKKKFDRIYSANPALRAALTAYGILRNSTVKGI
ncbi:MAG: glycosyltransferase family 2 protein [Candidatus Omnitrophota bacterium]|jgi:GT2 family glycosyltransferase